VLIELVQVEPALFVYGEFYDGVAVVFEVSADGQHGGVLNSGGDDFAFVWRGGESTLYSGVIAFSL
jgi:hypothetical protein